VFVVTETARDVHQLARQMARGEVRAASVAWVTLDELAPELRQRAGAGQRAQATPQAAQQSMGAGVRTSQAAAAAAPSMAQAAAAQPAAVKAAVGRGQPADGWLVPPYVDPSGQGRDSLGRSASPGDVNATVAADKALQGERQARWRYLQRAYKDPHGARAALDELVKREGWTSAAARLAREPEQLGQLLSVPPTFSSSRAVGRSSMR